MIQDTLGDRLKSIEQAEAGRKAIKGKPLMARLDGRAFHTFTKGLQRPYDASMSTLMINTTRYLIEETHALVGYTQSDEISLCWYVPEDSQGQYLFDGKFQKLTSVLAATASSVFMKYIMMGALEGKKHTIPTFDCRVWQVDHLHDAYLNYLWRQDDAVKNAISMAAQAEFSHGKLQGKSGIEMKQMLMDIDKPFDNHPQFFKSGTFLRRVTQVVELDEEQLAKIPVAHRPIGPVLRSTVKDVDIGLLRSYDDPITLLFE